MVRILTIFAAKIFLKIEQNKEVCLGVTNQKMLKETTAKTILHYHKQQFATNWDANIYRGCAHNCIYCFAQYSHKYLEDTDFFNNIMVKSNAPELLYKELAKPKWDKSPVNVCGISDCYQPEEEKYKIMPRVIRSFIAKKNPLVICTKSTLILRDMELIKELNDRAEVSVMISVSTLDEDKRKFIEPNAAPTLERLKMLKQFQEIGCKTSVLFMPIIPYISDDKENMDAIFNIAKTYNLGSINAWPLHLRGNTKKVFYAFLKQHFPDLLLAYHKLYKNGNVSKEYSVE
ncbi:MAG: radical SAM protein [Bacteroidetes bacterium 4572_77]|nr:MAG: radical SAM protein [Bacteroidetes bacterium 4572_77]